MLDLSNLFFDLLSFCFLLVFKLTSESVTMWFSFSPRVLIGAVRSCFHVVIFSKKIILLICGLQFVCKSNVW